MTKLLKLSCLASASYLLDHHDEKEPSSVPTANTNLGRGLSESLEKMGKKVLPPIGQRIAVAEAVHGGLTTMEYAPHSPARAEFYELARAVDKILRR